MDIVTVYKNSPKFFPTLALVFLATRALVSCANTASLAHDEAAASESANTPTVDTATAPRRAHAYYARGDLQGAITVLKEATRADPDDAQLHFMLGSAYFRQQQWNRAVDEYQQAARLRPRHPDTHLSLGYALYRADQVEEATAAWLTALQQTPGDALMHLSLAVGLNQLGQNLRARQHVARAIKVDNSWQYRLSIDIRWTPEMLDEINSLVKQIEGT